MASEKRGRVNVKPLGSTLELTILQKAFPGGFPRGWSLVAEFHGVEDHSDRHFTDRGWLIRHNQTQRFATWLARGCMRSVDQRKAEVAVWFLKTFHRDAKNEVATGAEPPVAKY